MRSLPGYCIAAKPIYGVNVYGVNVYGVNVYGVNVYGVNVYGVNVYGVNVYGVNVVAGFLFLKRLKSFSRMLPHVRCLAEPSAIM